ncbi:transposase [Candidatus Uhrbacteria bacterium]|nr:transposase [Candidatus Uhrbacteria bacterium]MBD3283836.1 transposase [Candidatus Uhrbacteria bacterium]
MLRSCVRLSVSLRISLLMTVSPACTGDHSTIGERSVSEQFTEQSSERTTIDSADLPEAPTKKATKKKASKKTTKKVAKTATKKTATKEPKAKKTVADKLGKDKDLEPPKPDREPLCFSIAHAYLGVTYVCEAKSFTDKGQPNIRRLTSEEAKERFVLEDLRKGDTVYMELGGPNDRIALLAAWRGVRVMRIPTFRISNNDATREAIETEGWIATDERPAGNESGDKLTARKTRALAIAAKARHHSTDFLEMKEEDRLRLQLKKVYRGWRKSFKTVLAGYQRLLAEYFDDYLLELITTEDPHVVANGRVASQAALRCIWAMIDVFPKEKQEEYAATLGLEKLESRRSLSREDITTIFRKVLEMMLDDDDVQAPFMNHWRKSHKKLEQLVKADPIYRAVLEPIPGVGVSIAARIITAIGEIERFPSQADLIYFAGYHTDENGQAVRRRSGVVSNWNPELKQAVWQFAHEQVVKMPGTVWRERLDLRRAYDLYKILRNRQAKADDQQLNYEILPVAFRSRTITETTHMTPEDLPILSAHVDKLRKQAGTTSKATSDDEDQDAALSNVKDPVLGKLVAGVKQQSYERACRWLGSRFLKHLYKEWRHARGLSRNPATYRDAEGNVHFTRGSKARQQGAERYRRKHGEDPPPPKVR